MIFHLPIYLISLAKHAKPNTSLKFTFTSYQSKVELAPCNNMKASMITITRGKTLVFQFIFNP